MTLAERNALVPSVTYSEVRFFAPADMLRKSRKLVRILATGKSETFEGIEGSVLCQNRYVKDACMKNHVMRVICVY